MPIRRKRRNHRRRRALRRRLRAHRAARHPLELERLEPRVLLTTLIGGDTFLYLQAPPDNDDFENIDSWPLMRIEAEGDIMAELIGHFIPTSSRAEVAGSNDVLSLGHLPVFVVESAIGRTGSTLFGGQGGQSTVRVIGHTPIDDPATPPTPDFPSPIIPDTDNPDINLHALASRSEGNGGETFAFNIDEDGTVLQLVVLDVLTGAATVVTDWTPVDVAAISSTGATFDGSDDVQGADFRPLFGDPEDGLLYVNLRLDDQDTLFTVDVDAGGRAAIAASLTEVGQIDVDTGIVTTLAWEVSGPTRGGDPPSIHLWAFRTEGGITPDADGDDTGQLLRINPATGAILTTHTLSWQLVAGSNVFLEPLTDIRGIEIPHDDPRGDRSENGELVAEFDQMMAIDAENDFLFSIPLGSPVPGPNLFATAIAPITEFDDIVNDVDPVSGDEMSGLSFHPLMVNPFTGDRGVLLGTDFVSDELIIIDSPRPTDVTGVSTEPGGFTSGLDGLFSIYVSQASPGSSITITEVDRTTGDLVPFNGSTDITIRFGFDDDDLATFGNIGGVFVGGRTHDVVDTDGEEFWPIIQGQLGSRLGVRPLFEDDVLTDPNADDNVTAGLIVEESLLSFLPGNGLFDMMGFNVDRVGGLSVSLDGQTIAAIDTDGVNANGQSAIPTGGSIPDFIFDQLTLIDPVTGAARFTPRDVVVSGTGEALSGVLGLDFGDVDFDDVEQLFAIYSVGGAGAPTLGTIDISDLTVGQFEFTPIGALRDGAGTILSGTRAMAFTPGEGSINGRQGLFVVDNFNQLWEVDPATGELIDTNGNVIADLTTAGDVIRGPDRDGNGIGDEMVITSMDFDADGRLFAHEPRGGQLVDLDLTGRGSGVIRAGRFTETSFGSLRPGIGDIAFDFANNRFLAADNSISELGVLNEGASAESALLMELTGLQTDSPVGQDMDDFSVAGAMVGRVNSAGSFERFFTSWILTGGGNIIPFGGHVTSVQPFGPPEIPGNFTVEGDLRALYSIAPFGSDTVGDGDPIWIGPPGTTPGFISGFDMVIGGRLGGVHSVAGSFTGSLTVINEEPVDGLTAQEQVQREFEDRFEIGNPEDPPNRPVPAEGSAWDDGRIVRNDGVFFNDTFDTAQRLGSLRDFTGADGTSVRVRGVLNSIDDFNDDDVDYFAVSLMAGQTVTVQLVDVFGLGIVGPNVGVFDPDGRLVATDYTNVDPLVVENQPFRFTPEMPGEYRFAIAWDGDTNFNGALDANEAITFFNGDVPYELRIDNAGDLALGGLFAARHFWTAPGAFRPVEVQRGDLGSLTAGLQFDVRGIGPITVVTGNLRSMDGDSIGRGDVSNFIGGTHPLIEVPLGSVGLLRSRGEITFGILRIFSLDVGGDVQVIDAFDDLFIDMRAGGGLGVMRAGSVGMEIGPPSSIVVNADGFGRDGVIDLIDVANDFGRLGAGGPAITTGPGGNVRFIRVGGEVFQDAFFGGGSPTRTDFLAGVSANIQDDSGAQITISPGMSLNEDFDPDQIGQPGADPEVTTLFEPAAIAVTTYGIRGSGGSAIVKIESDGTLELNSDSLGNADRAGVEIGEIVIESMGIGVGQPIDPATGAPDPDADLQLLVDQLATVEDVISGNPDVIQPDPAGGVGLVDLNLVISGSAPVDVFGVLAATNIDIDEFGLITGPIEWESINGVIRSGVFSELVNTTGGDMVNLVIGGAGDFIVRGSIGLTIGHTGARVEGLATGSVFTPGLAPLPFPYNQARTVVLLGNTVNMVADKAIGNVVVNNPGLTDDGDFTGDQQSLLRVVADRDGVNDPDTFEGIAGPIFVTGDLTRVQIGEGIAPSGSGNLGRAGLYVLGDIGRVTGDGIGHDIRGDIVANGVIRVVELTGGASIINADIMSVFDPTSPSFGLEGSRELPVPLVVTEIADVLPNPNFEILRISVRDGGGILGGFFVAADIRDVSVSDGFGIFNSRFILPGEGAFDDVTADGFGIRGTAFFGGAQTDQLIAQGDGRLLDILDFTPSVRQSELLTFDPESGLLLSRLNDLHAYLGTSVLNPVLIGISQSGVIEDVVARQSRDLGRIEAALIRGTAFTPGFEPSTTVLGGQTVLAFANEIGRIVTTTSDNRTGDSVNGLLVRSGELMQFRPDGGNVSALDMEIAGLIRNVDIRQNLLGSSRIAASGPNGDIQRVTIRGNMVGDIEATGRVDRISIGGDMTGDLFIDGLADDRRPALGLLDLRGSLANGSFNVHGDVGQIRVAGGLGAAGDQLLIRGDLGRLDVGRRPPVGVEPILALDVMVLGDLNQLRLAGRLTGELTVEGDARRVDIAAAANTPPASVIVSGTITVGGSLDRLSLRDGDIDGVQVRVGDSIGRVDFRNGNLLEDAELVSAFGDIDMLMVRDGDLMGRIAAPNGVIGRMMVRGSDLGATVSALALQRLQLDGSILDGAMIDIAGPIDMMRIGRDIEQGAVIYADSASRIDVRRDLNGDVMLGYSPDRAMVRVRGDFGGSLEVGTPSLRLDVREDFDGELAVYGSLDQMRIGDVLSGIVVVTDSAGRLMADSMDGAVILTGLGLDRLQVRQGIDDSLIQVGISAGEDETFGTADAGDTSRMAVLGMLRADSITNSLIAAGGDVGRAQARSLIQDSSISAGFSIGGTAAQAAVDDVLGGGSPFASLALQGAMRSQADRVLFRGNIGDLRADQLLGSDVTAGVDPVNGVFGDGDDSVATSLTGGRGMIDRLRITTAADGASNLVTDAGIGRQTGGGAANTVRVDFDVFNDLDAPIVGPPAGTASDGASVVVNTGGVSVTVSISGAGFVDVFDAGAGDAVVDALVIRGADSRSSVAVSADGPVGIGRVLMADDAQLRDFAFIDPANVPLSSGNLLNLVGDGTDAVDLWLDSELNGFAVGGTGEGFTGQIGGGVRGLIIQQLGGRLLVGGAVDNAAVFGSTGDPLLTNTVGLPAGSDAAAEITVDSTGNIFVFDPTLGGSGQLYQADLGSDPATIPMGGGPFDVTDLVAGGLSLDAIDFDNGPADTLYGVAELFNQNPTIAVGPFSDSAVSMRGLAINTGGRVMAISSTVDLDGDGDVDDQLVEIDPTTGAFTVVGTLKDLDNNTFTNDVLTLAFNDAGTLFALVSDRDGDGNAFAPGDGAALIRIATAFTLDADGNRIVRVTSPTSNFQRGVLLDGGGVPNDFTAMAVDSGGTIHAIRRNVLGTVDQLVTISTAVGSVGDVTSVNGGTPGNENVQVNGVFTDIIGMGFAAGGELIAVTNDGVSAQQIVINLANPSASSELTPPGTVDPTLDAFALGRTGVEFEGFGYDSDDAAGGVFFTSPGLTPTLGTIDPATGQFNRLRGLAADASGAPLADEVLSISLVRNPVTGNDDVFAVTADGRLLQYAATDGALIANLGAITGPADSVGAPSASPQTVFFGPTPYLSAADSPFEMSGLGSTFFLEDFEDNLLNVPGVTADNGGPRAPSTLTDSVDGDDGAIDGDGDGHSYLVRPGSDTVTFTFDEMVLGQLPTHVGIVSTDGFGEDGEPANTVEFFDGDGNLIGTLDDPVQNFDVNTTDDDRFLGVFHADGIGSIRVSNAGTGSKGLEVDHLQYGFGPLNTVFVSEAAGPALEVVSLDRDHGDDDVFGTPDDRLLAVDGRFDRLIRIGLRYNGGGIALFDPDATIGLTEIGSANASDLPALAFDPVVERFLVFSEGLDRIAELRGTDQDSLGGAVAGSFRNATITGPFDGRLAATGNSFDRVLISGDFFGSLVTAGSIGQFQLDGGDFGGAVVAGQGIDRFMINGGDFLADGIVSAATGSLGDLRISIDRGTNLGGDFAGRVFAQAIDRFNATGEAASTAFLQAFGAASDVAFGGDFAGRAVFDAAGRMTLGGDLTSTGSIDIDRNADDIRITGGTAAGSEVSIGGHADRLAVQGVHAGQIAIDRGLGSGDFGGLNNALLVVGEHTDALRIRGPAVGSIVSLAMRIGPDRDYNTADDVITGGLIGRVQFDDLYRDTVFSAGVLPRLGAATRMGTPGLIADNRLFVGNPGAADIADVDSAEAGGLLPTRVDRLDVSGRVISSNPAIGRRSVVAVADDLQQLGGEEAFLLATRVYDDPLGPPRVLAANLVNNSTFEIIFSEELNTSSLILAQDANGDSDGDGNPFNDDLADVLGTVRITGDGQALNDVNLAYEVRENARGDRFGVLIGTQPGGFNVFNLTVELSGGGDGALLVEPAIFDRSSGRSALRDFDRDGDVDGDDVADALPEAPFANPDGAAILAGATEDPFATILDGDGDGEEGGNAVRVLTIVDAPDTFLGALNAPRVPITDGGQAPVSGRIDGPLDVDIFRFAADAFQFLSAEFIGDPLVQMAVFVHDTQGTAPVTDDTFEALSRWEDNLDAFFGAASPLFQAFELPNVSAAPGSPEDMLDGVADGLQNENLEFFLVVAPGFGFFDPSADNNYQVLLTLADTDVDLLNLQPTGDLPVGEQIAYISNVIGENNNLLGAQPPQQLVFLNFDGGTSTATDLGTVNFSPFDAALLDPAFAGSTQAMIDQIVDDIFTIYTTQQPSHPRGAFGVQLLDAAGLAALGGDLSMLADGVTFTTEDPADFGFDPDTEFTTLFIGRSNTFQPGLLGIASQVDFANLEKADEGLVLVENFQFFSAVPGLMSPDPATRLLEFSRALANVIAHELGHTLGLNHTERLLIADDPDNDPSTPDDSNAGEPALMSAGPNLFPEDFIDNLLLFGTSPIDSDEFPIGDKDNVDLLLLWLA